MQITNHMRATWALHAVAQFMSDTGTDREDAIADLVCDLCHLAKEWKQDPLHEMQRGIAMYADERDYPPDGWAPCGMAASVQISVSIKD